MIDYQEVVALAAKAMEVALPIAIIFGLAERAVNAMLGMILGREKVRF